MSFQSNFYNTFRNQRPQSDKKLTEPKASQKKNKHCFHKDKKGDKDNGITLQAFLNCMDGFTCIEGTMLFITANKPEVLDYALLRSCRIDNKIELGFADKYQTKEMYKKLLPNQTDKFKEEREQILIWALVEQFDSAKAPLLAK